MVLIIKLLVKVIKILIAVFKFSDASALAETLSSLEAKYLQ